jgi:precorrin-6Y C5,15-methyltransferase (decarboxylating)
MNIQLIGAGPGCPETLTQLAISKIKLADLVLTTPRLFTKLGHLNPNSKVCGLSEIEGLIHMNKNLDHIAILASGDVGFYSLSSTLQKSLPEFQVTWTNGMSSLQTLAARMQQDYTNVRTVSVHGRDRSVVPFVSYHEHVFVLTGGAHKAHDVIQTLICAGLGAVTVTVGENLSDEEERIISDAAVRMSDLRFDNLSVMWIYNPNCVHWTRGLKDEDFERAKVPMTKAAVRSVSLSKLDVQPHEVVYDVGAGTGAVAISLARQANESFVYAIEKSADAVQLIRKNRMKLGAFNLNIIQGSAPECLANLPAPDKVFIGGSSGQLTSVVEVVRKKNPKVRIVVNAITLETMQEVLDCFDQLGFKVEIQCMAVTDVEPVGRYHMMKAQNPVYVISGENHE